jgi:glycerophosphoryl diester phosphodiesterase
MQIITHRGLEPRNKNFPYLESTREAFLDQLSRGYGLEFDPNFTSDGVCFVFHDGTLKRATEGADNRPTTEVRWDEIQASSFAKKWTIMTFEELISAIDQTRKPGEYSALHLKYKFQKKEYVNAIIALMKKHPGIEEKIYIFDASIETAEYIKWQFPEVKIFPSVAHAYDIKRYNECVGGTLLSVEEVLANIGLFAWVWLDEWDRIDEWGGDKMFYTSEVLDIFRKANLQIGLVTPELHGTSPGLLGGEAHQDAKDIEAWKTRMKQILALKPDYICTDYLDLV